MAWVLAQGLDAREAFPLSTRFRKGWINFRKKGFIKII